VLAKSSFMVKRRRNALLCDPAIRTASRASAGTRPRTRWQHCRVMKRLDERIAAAAAGSDARAELRRFARRLRSVAAEMAAHAGTLAAFEATPASEWEALAAARRRDLTAEFFEFVQTLAAAAGDDAARREGARSDSVFRLH